MSTAPNPSASGKATDAFSPVPTRPGLQRPPARPGRPVPEGASPAPTPPQRMSLAELVTTGAEHPTLPPALIVVHGDRGSGKTSFGALAPKSIVLAVEDPELLSIPRTVPRLVVATDEDIADTQSESADRQDARMRAQRRIWVRTMQYLQMLYQEKHDYKVGVIDTIDFLEPCCHAYCCLRDGQRSIAQNSKGSPYSWGEGYNVAAAEWHVFERLCQDLKRRRGMTIVLVSHSTSVRVKDATMPDHEKQGIKLHKHSAGLICDLADAVFYVKKEVTVWADGDPDKPRMKVQQSPRVLCHTRVGDGWEAKNRLFLPDPLPAFSWTAYSQCAIEGVRIKEELFAYLNTLPPNERFAAEMRLDETGWSVQTAAQLLGKEENAS